MPYYQIPRQHPHCPDEPWPFAITVSIGIAELVEQEEDFESLLQRADAALYQAKGKGRNCCQLADNILNTTQSQESIVRNNA